MDLRNLRDLLEDILEEQDRILFREAVASAEAGAPRGAFIMVWLSCAESLKRRFVAASRRDGVAKKIAGEIDRREKAQQAVDMYLLGEAQKYGFIDGGAYARLQHVYQMRCVYGHPYEMQPSPEDLVAAGAAVAELVLHQPLLLRHGYLEEQVRLLTTDRTFLDNQEAAVVEYAEEVAKRADPALAEWFIEKLWQAAEALVADKTQGLFVRRSVWFATTFLKAGFRISCGLSRVAGADPGRRGGTGWHS